MKTIIMYRILAILVFLTVATATCYAQGFSYKKKDAPWQNILKAMQQQTDLRFFVNTDFFDKIKNIDVDVINMPPLKFLDIYLRAQSFTYELRDKSVVISQVDQPFSSPAKTTGNTVMSFKGQIVDNKNNPLFNVNVAVIGTHKVFTTDSAGMVEVTNLDSTTMLEVTYVNCIPQKIKAADLNNKVIKLNVHDNELITVVSTGFQSLLRKGTTGSFDHINNDLINRRVSTDILDRLNGLISGLAMKSNADNSSEPSLSIRGRGTIFSNSSPLIVVDNFPYIGDIRNINPNDIESITILKDAAAAAIWGAYAGNGVIVITTKKGKLNQPVKLNVHANITVGQKPNQYYSPEFIQSADMIGIETYLFNKGHYDNYYHAMVNNVLYQGSLTPVIEILLMKKALLISDSDATHRINELKIFDVRRDFDKYFYRQSANQQYSVEINGGSTGNTYQFSVSHDHNLPFLTYNKYDRFTLNSYNAFLLSKKLEFQVGINYIESHSTNNNGGRDTVTQWEKNLYPYASLANENGEALPISKDLPLYIARGNQWAVDPYYYPLGEIRNADNQNSLNNTRITGSIQHKIFPSLRLEANCQYMRQNTTNENLQNLSTWYPRSLINLFYNPNASADRERNPVPIGGILDESKNELENIIMRGKVNFDKIIQGKHAISAIAGADKSYVDKKYKTNRQYGYNANTNNNNSSLDYARRFPTFHGIADSLTIPYKNDPKETIDVSISYYINLLYTYDDKYTISASVRKDMANIFGANINNRTVPLWSAGLAWLISNENLFDHSLVSYLKLRATIGYLGNVNTSLAAVQTFTAPATPTNQGVLWASINTPNNPDLGWERTRYINLGLDFELLHNHIAGRIDAYSKKCERLIGLNKLAPSAGYAGMGMLGFMSNTAKTQVHGVDIELKSQNIKGIFNWNTSFLFSYNIDKVLAYEQEFSSLSVAQANGGMNGIFTPVVGKPLSAIFSYKWAGVNPDNGDPVGFVGKDTSSDHKALIDEPVSNMKYNGPGQPVYFGSIINTFSCKSFTLSVNIGYKLGYYFKASTINYYALYNSGKMHSDFYKRWKNPGEITSVPAMIYPLNNTYRDDFFTNAAINVHRGDHVRLQDIRLSYDFNEIKLKNLSISNIRLYMYINNLGIIWKANAIGIDPDFGSGFKAPCSIAFGLIVNF